MGDLFKNVPWYIMRRMNILKYTLRAQETYDKAVARSPCMLRHVPDNLKTQEMCHTAVRMDPGTILVLDRVLLRFPSVLLFLVPDHIKTKGMCEKAVEKNQCLLDDVPDRLLTQEMCDIAVCMEPWSLRIFPDHFKSQEMCDEAVACHYTRWKMSLIGLLENNR